MGSTFPHISAFVEILLNGVKCMPVLGLVESITCLCSGSPSTRNNMSCLHSSDISMRKFSSGVLAASYLPPKYPLTGVAHNNHIGNWYQPYQLSAIIQCISVAIFYDDGEKISCQN